MVELVYQVRGLMLTFVQFMTVKVLEGICYNISRNPTRTISSFKVRMAMDATYTM